MFLRNCQLALVVLSTMLALGGPLRGQDRLAVAEAENRALRAELALLRAELAALRGSATCTAGEPGQGSAPLLRKLARAERDAALISLGMAPGPLRLPDDILGAFVPGEYIFLTTAPMPDDPAQVAAQFGLLPGQVLHVYGAALSGFAARLTADQLTRMRGRGDLRAVVRNGYVFASGAGQAPRGLVRPGRPGAARPVAADVAPLDVYLFDTGIRAAHADLQGRVARDGFSSFENGLGAEDCAGHGTHVAARIAGRTLGQTARARLVSVKVMDRFGAGDVATVVAGIDWLLRNRDAARPALVNMSLTRRATEDPSPLDMAVQRLIDAGAVVVVAAGNAASDVAAFSPARVVGAITVGSVGPAGLSHFSNAGVGVDLYTSGESVRSASIRDVCGLSEMSGTSMAAPLVTGLMADMMAQGMDGDEALARLKSMAEERPTGMRTGERTRLVLNVTEPLATLCHGAPRVIYDMGLAE